MSSIVRQKVGDKIIVFLLISWTVFLLKSFVILPSKSMGHFIYLSILLKTQGFYPVLPALCPSIGKISLFLPVIWFHQAPLFCIVMIGFIVPIVFRLATYLLNESVRYFP
ncbi:hypothetical protein SPSIL_009570 [Sporomusa silvacetica DSM 10669]|uniref:Uncharacterized protein n=1 Tax=Sporomusa silvacetica DSM 10669 TaxID=1123289 RepID=A0ABZ3IHI7_9FIRM|nr:hypothetical protein SPSIL_55390 [Sporomusa silvacetica DSM 10669]